VVQAVGELRAHFAGASRQLAAIPLDASVFTPFQAKVANLLRSTLPGQSITYGELAFLAGRPGAARAVGQAVRRNPILVLVPCHRVVAAQGPGGWSAFGSPGIKERLLDLERPDTGTHAARLP
jgi:methylated-DNA-[protein]-cysteine S-methyltransferase